MGGTNAFSAARAATMMTCWFLGPTVCFSARAKERRRSHLSRRCDTLFLRRSCNESVIDTLEIARSRRHVPKRAGQPKMRLRCHRSATKKPGKRRSIKSVEALKCRICVILFLISWSVISAPSLSALSQHNCSTTQL